MLGAWCLPALPAGLLASSLAPLIMATIIIIIIIITAANSALARARATDPKREHGQIAQILIAASRATRP